MQVDFYQLAGTPAEQVIASLAQKVLDSEERLLIVAEDHSYLAKLDRILWDQGAGSFLPHGLSGGADDARQPILLSTSPDAPNQARNMLIADGIWSEAALTYERSFYLFDDSTLEDARLVWKLLSGRDGIERRYWAREGADGSGKPEACRSGHVPLGGEQFHPIIFTGDRPVMAVTRTFSIIKPDATRRNLTGAVTKMLEEAGLRVIASKRIRMSRDQAEGFYEVHKERPFYNDLCTFMTSGPVVVQVLEGENAVARNREVMGATNPAQAEEGTIRRTYAELIEANSVHGSDSEENAKTEIAFFFNPEEIVG